MSNSNLRNITNHFQDVQLISLASLSIAKEISPCDHGGPYVVLQPGFDPEDPKVIADEFVLGRSGQWMSLSFFFKLTVADRRAEYVFGTAAEVMKIMSDLPPKPFITRPGAATPPGVEATEGDEMSAVINAAKGGSGITGSQLICAHRLKARVGKSRPCVGVVGRCTYEQETQTQTRRGRGQTRPEEIREGAA